MCVGDLSVHESPEARAKRLWPKGAEISEKIIKKFALCDEGERIAWRSASIIEEAILDHTKELRADLKVLEKYGVVKTS